jgi:uncharacterized membrane-anchored protein
MFCKSAYVAIFCCAFGITTAWGTIPDSGKSITPEFKGSLNFRKGQIQLPSGVAKLRVPENLRYLGPEDTERVLVNAWGNPAGNRTLGMLVPVGLNPGAKDAWGIVIAYREDGHVADKDADSIDYDHLLKEMREGMVEVNKERSKAGNERIDLIGWAVKPRYDKTSHTLSWAKELSFGGSVDHILNYNISILGRNGVLSLNAVAGMGQVAEVANNIPALLAAAEFNPGHRYEDFNTTTDRVASYGIAGLVSGGLAAKNGFFSRLVVIPSIGKIVLIVLLSALGGFLVHFFKRKKSANLPSS